MKKNNYLLALAAITITGFYLRFRVMLFADLWLDEVFSWSLAQLPLSDLIFSKEQYWDLVHPPLYYIVLKLWMLGGDSEVWLRILSLPFYVANSILVFYLGKKLFNDKSALIAVALYAVNPFFVNLDFQVRMYTMALFAQLLFLCFFVVKFMKKEHTRTRDLLVLGTLLALAFYVDYSAIWLVVSICFWILLFEKQKKLKNLGVVVGTFISLTSYQLVRLYTTLTSGMRPGSVPENLTLNFIFEQLLAIIGVLDLGRFLLSSIVLSITLSLFLIAVLVELKKKKTASSYLFTVVMVILPTSMSLFFSMVVSPIFLARNLLITAIAIIIFIGVLSVTVFPKFSLPLVSLLFVLLLSQSVSLNGFYVAKGFKEIAYTGHSDLKHTIIYLPNTYHQPLSIYYLPRLEKNKNKTEQIFAKSREDLQILTDRKDESFSVLYSDFCLGDENCAEMLEYITADFCSEVRCITVRQI